MLGLVDAVEALLALEPPGLHAPHASSRPRLTSEQIRADRQRRRDALQARPALVTAPPPRAAAAGRAGRPTRVYEVPLEAVASLDRASRVPRPGPATGALLALLVAVGAALLGGDLLIERGPAVSARRSQVAAGATAPDPCGRPEPARETAAHATPTAPARAASPQRRPSALPAAAEGLPETPPAPAWASPAPPGPATLPGLAGPGVVELVETLSDPAADPAARAAAAAALGASPLPELERALDDAALAADPVGRVLALEQLARRGRLSISAAIAVDRALGDPDGGVRAAAARAMVAVPQAASRLIPRLPAERDPVVLKACLETIGRTAAREHLPTLELYAQKLPSAARALAEACERLGVERPAR